MKKIFFIIFSYSMGGGAEALLTLIVNNLNPEKYEIGIMEITHAEIKKEPVNDNIKIYPYYTAENAPGRNFRMRLVNYEWDRVIEECIPQDYDLYVSFNYFKPSFLLPPGKKCIAWVHGDVYDLAGEKNREAWQRQNKAFYKADKIITISDITTQSIIDLFPEHKDKICMISNGVDINAIRNKSLENTDIKLMHPAIISVGRLEKGKNPLRTIQIFEKVHQKLSEAHLYYLGYGELEKEILEKSKLCGLEDNVHLLGYYENPFPIIAQSDILVMFSITEGYGMVLAEALALDKPFVATRVGAAEMLSNEGHCARVIDTDEEAAEAIIDLLKENREEQICECRKSVERIDLKEYIRQIEDLFDQVLTEDIKE